MKIIVNHYGQPRQEYESKSCPFCRGNNLKLNCNHITIENLLGDQYLVKGDDE